MQSARYNHYVLPRILRIYHHLCGPIAAAGTGFFSLLLWYVAITQNHSQIPCGIAAMLLGIISVVLATKYIEISKQIMLQYHIDQDQVINSWGSNENSISIRSGLFCSKVSITFTVGNSHIKESFLLCSNSPFSPSIQSFSGGMNVIKSVLYSGAVIIPMTFCNEDSYLTARLKSCSIPAFPRVSYLYANISNVENNSVQHKEV